MVRSIMLAAGLATALPGIASAQRGPEVLTRSGKWVVEYGRDACHIFAEFGTGDDLVVARFTRFAPTERFVLALAGKRLRANRVHDLVDVDFGLGVGPASERVMTGTAGKLPAVFFGLLRIDGRPYGPPGQEEQKITPEQEASASGVTIAMRGKSPFRLETGSFGKMFEVMRDCVDKLVTKWGYDPKAQEEFRRRATPIGSPANWITDADYPIGAVQEGTSGIVQFRLDLDAEGKVAGCFILDRTEPDAFASVTCNALRRRAKFEPALDAGGEPIRSFFVSRINYVTGRSPLHALPRRR